MRNVFSFVLGGAMALATMVGVSLVSNSASAAPIVTTSPFTTGTPCGDQESGKTYTDGNCTYATVADLDVGDGLNLSWTLNIWDGDTLEDVVLITGMITIVAIEDDYIDLDIMLTNDSSSTGSITKFGFTTEGAALTGVDWFDGDGADRLIGATINNNFVGSFFTDVCVFTNSCQVNNVQDGLQPGEWDAFSLTLWSTDYSFGSLITLDSFLIKFQGSPNSVELAALVTVKGDRTEIPEPGTLGILGMGLLGLAAMGRRRRRAA